jgi:manganese transport protein
MTPPPGSAAEGAATVLPDASVALDSPFQQIRARGRLRATLAMLGPAFVAAVAYVDPGNFATNLQGGAQFGFLLLWVVFVANLMAMVIQYMSAKLGIVTGQNLPEICRQRFPRFVSRGLWVQAELMAMSTDIAEFVGAALGLNLLFGVPLLTAGLMTGVIAFVILELQTRGYRKFELAITALLGLVFLGFLYEALRIGPSAHATLSGFVPHFSGTDSILLAVGIIGATVMPHAIYLHSALCQNRVRPRDDAERRSILRFEKLDVCVALGLAGIINMAMLAVAAQLFHQAGQTDISSIQQAHQGFAQMVGGGAALAFAVALLGSGASSSSVGTYAGQIVMQGFINVRVPLVVRRIVTMLPALAVLATGYSPTDALVLSQVVLSFGIPMALIPLAIVTSQREVMGDHANGRYISAVSWCIVALVTMLNVYLIYQQIFGGG